MRRFTGLALLSGVLLVTGCTASAPEPSPRASECGPDDARVRWGQLAEAPPAPIGYRSLTVEGGEFQEGESIEFEYSTTVDSEPARFEEPDWVTFLVEDLNRSGQSLTALGDPSTDFPSDAVKPSTDGEFIIGYQLQQVFAPFSVECGPITEGEGTITTTRGDLGTTLVECATDPVSDDPYPVELLEYCDS